jgi:hypothetical protein
MKIVILKMGEIIDCSPGLALRKIEQGKAVPVIQVTQAAKKENTAKAAGEG